MGCGCVFAVWVPEGRDGAVGVERRAVAVVLHVDVVVVVCVWPVWSGWVRVWAPCSGGGYFVPCAAGPGRALLCAPVRVSGGAVPEHRVVLRSADHVPQAGCCDLHDVFLLRAVQGVFGSVGTGWISGPPDHFPAV